MNVDETPTPMYRLWRCEEELEARVRERDAAREGADALARAVRDFLIVNYRYVHQTGGKPTTDEDMDAAMRGLLDALAAQASGASRTLPTGGLP
jgi:hypothetical protein